MARTFRFKLTLNDQNDPKDKHAFNEFNWLDLVAAEEQSRVEAKMSEIVRKKAELTGQRDPMRPLDPFASDDEDQIQQLAKKFEAKYGKHLPKLYFFDMCVVFIPPPRIPVVQNILIIYFCRECIRTHKKEEKSSQG